MPVMMAIPQSRARARLRRRPRISEEAWGAAPPASDEAFWQQAAERLSLVGAHIDLAAVEVELAGMVGRGTTRIDRVYHIDRGYEKIEQKLAAVGADIERVKDKAVAA